MEEEHKREVERQKERAAEKDRLRAQQLEERKRREKEEIEKANLSEEEKRRLLKEHGDNMRHLEVSRGVAEDSGFFCFYHQFIVYFKNCKVSMYSSQVHFDDTSMG